MMGQQKLPILRVLCYCCYVIVYMLAGKTEDTNMDTPNCLYKYKSLSNEEKKDHVREMFEDHVVWFSKRSDFNDPFELHFSPSFEATTDEKIEVFTCALQKKNPNLTYESAKAEAMFAFSSPPSILEQWEQKRLSLHEKRLNEEVGVFSLTEYNDDILRWSHYANEHRGICIEFRPVEKEHEKFYYQAHKVVYPKDNRPPQLNFYHYRKNPGELAVKCLATKALHWKYEGEWRIIDVINGPGKRSIPSGIISSVILGCRIESSNRNLMMRLASSYATPVNIYQARIKSGYYELEIQKI